MKTLPLGLADILASYNIDWGLLTQLHDAGDDSGDRVFRPGRQVVHRWIGGGRVEVVTAPRVLVAVPGAVETGLKGKVPMQER